MITFTIPSMYEALDLIMQNYPHNYNQKSKVEIETLFDHCLENITNDSEKFLTTLFINGLKKYIQPAKIKENIYLKQFEIPQIELFSILIDQFPFVKYSQEIVNNAILNIARNRKKIILIDIGLGLGVQMLCLLKLLNETSIETVTIVGIEPAEPALKKAEVAFEEIKSELGFKLNFVPIMGYIEKLYFDELEVIIDRFGGDLIVNASLALHHIQSLQNRQKVINHIRKLNPKAFFIIEPNVDHFEPVIYKRFQNCFSHFYHVFQVIDELKIDQKAKNGLKLFFGREIDDIIGKENNERFEKHEPAYRWLEKLNIAGFNIHDDFYHPKIPHNVGISIEMKKSEYLAFQFKSEIVLSVICAIL